MNFLWKPFQSCCFYSTSDGSNQQNTEAQLSLIMDDQQLFIPFLTQVFYQEVELSDCMQTLFRDAKSKSSNQSQRLRSSSSMQIDQQVPTDTRTSRSSSDSSSAYLDGNAGFRAKREANENQRKHCQESQHDFECTQVNLDPDILPSYEIDPSRLEENDDVCRNRENLLKLTKRILESILMSAQDFPPQLNSMCICLSQVLHKKFPNSDTNIRAVSTVIFLRFINPAIVSPYESGIVNTQPHPRVMRGLMLVSKILQNIANNVEFSKEEHMLPFNNFVRQQFEPLRNWISQITNERDYYNESKTNEDVTVT